MDAKTPGQVAYETYMTNWQNYDLNKNQLWEVVADAVIRDFSKATIATVDLSTIEIDSVANIAVMPLTAGQMKRVESFLADFAGIEPAIDSTAITG